MTVPIFGSLAGYDRSWLRGDLIAGLTVWAVFVPEALALGAHDLGQVGDLLSAHPETNLAVFATIDEAIAAIDS